MKNKTLMMMSMFLLTATLLMCFTSAASFTVSGPVTFTPGVGYKEFTIKNDHNETIELNITIAHFNDTTFRITDLTTKENGIKNLNGVKINASASKKFKIEPTSEINYTAWQLKEKYSEKIVVTNDLSETVNSLVIIENTEVCNYDIIKNDVNALNRNLVITLSDPEVIGFGEEWKVYPFDEINIEAEFKNKHKTIAINDIEFKWGIYDVETLSWFFEEDESGFDLDEKEENTEIINYRFNDDIYQLAEGKYIFYVWAEALMEDDAETPICVSKYESISFEIERDFVILDKIRVPESVPCNQEVSVLTDVVNIGKKEQKDFYVKVENTELGINQKVSIEKLRAFKSKEGIELSFNIPKDAEEKDYELKFGVYDKEGNLYDDGDDDYSEFSKVLKVAGDCIVNKARAVVSDSMMISEKALEGEELVIVSTISNTGNAEGTFKVSVDGEDDWAESVLISKTSLVLGPGESEDINISLVVKEDVSGEKEFNISVLGSGSTAKQSVIVDVAKKGVNKLVLGIVLICIILVVAIVIVVLRIADSK